LIIIGGGVMPPPIQWLVARNFLEDPVLDRPLGALVELFKKHYPSGDIIIEDGTVAVGGSLGGLLKHLLKTGHARRFAFITHLIEYVDYTQVVERTDQFIEGLCESGIIFRDLIERDLYRLSQVGFDVLERIEIRAGIPRKHSPD
jgi:hypothetical protein